MSTFTQAQLQAVSSKMKQSDKTMLAGIANGVKSTGYTAAMAVARLSNQGLVSVGASGALHLTNAGQRVATLG